MPKYSYIATVEADTREQANRVMAERLGHDEDYGFDYRVDWQAINGGDNLIDVYARLA